jgi:hypothetical protein
MEVTQFQKRIAIVLLVAHLLMFLVLFVSYWLGGLLPEDLQDVLKILIPVNSLYMTALVKFMVATGRTVENPDAPKAPLLKVRFSSTYRSITWLISTVHIAVLVLVIILNHFKVISFESLMTSVPVVESLFGAYAGIILLDLFSTGEKK